MTDTNAILGLLTEIRDNQQESLRRQQEHLDIAKEQIERSRAQVEESIALQRQAIDKVKKISRIAVPGVFLCIGLIVYLMVRYL